MKKFLSIILALALLCVLFAGCQSRGESGWESSSATSSTSGSETGSDPSEPSEASSKSLTELPQIYLCLDTINPESGSNIQKYLDMVPGHGKDFLFITETLPNSGPDRENTLTRIRTEILAGKGPDLFLCINDSIWDNSGTRALFPFPEKAMQNRIFLPLDDYIAGAERMEWERFQPEVMAVGANDEGQQLLPIVYDLRTVIFPKETYDAGSVEGPMTWEEMYASEDQLTRCIANYNWLDCIFGRLADYKKDCPLFSEEELLALVTKSEELRAENNSGGFPDYTRANGPDYPLYPYVLKDDIYLSPLFTYPSYVDWDLANDDFWMLPCCNQEGGLTATVMLFGGINRNTDYPEESFRFFDTVLSPDVMHLYPLDIVTGYPVDTTLGSEDWSFGSTVRMNAWNFDQYQALLDEINAVNFDTEVNDAFSHIKWDIIDEDMPIEEAVHKAYMEISMLLGEA